VRHGRGHGVLPALHQPYPRPCGDCAGRKARGGGGLAVHRYHDRVPAAERALPRTWARYPAVHAMAVLVNRAVRGRGGVLAAGGLAADAVARHRGGRGRARPGIAGTVRPCPGRLDRAWLPGAVLVPCDLLHDGGAEGPVRLIRCSHARSASPGAAVSRRLGAAQGPMAAPRRSGSLPMAQHKPLDQQVIVITGASSGIGLCTALSAAEQGARVVLAARSLDVLEEAVATITSAGGQALAAQCDVSRRADVDAVARLAHQRFGGIDTWVNNAGVSIYGRLEEVSEADSRRLFDVNFWGVVNGSLAALPFLRASGGVLVNV